MALQDTLEQLQSIDFNDLDLNNIGSWPGAVKVILVILLFVVVLGLGYYLHITDKQDKLDREVAEEQELRKEYEDKAAQAANLEAYRQQNLVLPRLLARLRSSAFRFGLERRFGKFARCRVTPPYRGSRSTCRRNGFG